MRARKSRALGAALIVVCVALASGGCEREPRVSTAGPGVPPQAVLYTEVPNADLLAVLDRDYSPTRTLGYGRARDELYGWEQATTGAVCGLYTEYCVTLGGGDASRAAGARGINAEHVWPQSMGARQEPLRSDLHHLFPSRENVNSSRGNLPFGEVPDAQADAWYLADGSQSRTPDGPLAPWSERGRGLFEPREDRKGDVARAVFYVVTVYPEFVDAGFFRAMERTLLVWNRADPPDEREQTRNRWVEGLQGTANPFILDPTLADRIWNGGLATEASGGSPAAPEAPPVAATGPLWINEIHYDDRGEDEGEGIEVAGPDGTALDGWTLVLVNGADGGTYRTVSLAGRLVGDGIGAEWVPLEGLQNGSPDGAALIAPDGSTADAVAWEGPLVARDGPAGGLGFPDIGVAESGSTREGTSLQRTGAGREGADFQWIGGAPASPGWINAGQSYTGTR